LNEELYCNNVNNGVCPEKYSRITQSTDTDELADSMRNSATVAQPSNDNQQVTQSASTNEETDTAHSTSLPLQDPLDTEKKVIVRKYILYKKKG